MPLALYSHACQTSGNLAANLVSRVETLMEHNVTALRLNTCLLHTSWEFGLQKIGHFFILFFLPVERETHWTWTTQVFNCLQITKSRWPKDILGIIPCYIDIKVKQVWSLLYPAGTCHLFHKHRFAWTFLSLLFYYLLSMLPCLVASSSTVAERDKTQQHSRLQARQCQIQVAITKRGEKVISFVMILEGYKRNVTRRGNQQRPVKNRSLRRICEGVVSMNKLERWNTFPLDKKPNTFLAIGKD